MFKGFDGAKISKSFEITKIPPLITSNGDVLRIYIPIFAYMVVLFTLSIKPRQNGLKCEIDHFNGID